MLRHFRNSFAAANCQRRALEHAPSQRIFQPISGFSAVPTTSYFLTVKRTDERHGWFNRHRKTRRLNVYIISALNLLVTRLLVSHLRQKTRTFYVDFSRSVFKMAVPPITRNKIRQNTRLCAHKTKTDNAQKSPLTAGSAEEWYVQNLRVPGSPCRDGGSSDELRCQIIWSTSRHALKNQKSKTEIPENNRVREKNICTATRRGRKHGTTERLFKAN